MQVLFLWISCYSMYELPRIHGTNVLKRGDILLIQSCLQRRFPRAFAEPSQATLPHLAIGKVHTHYSFHLAPYRWNTEKGLPPSLFIKTPISFNLPYPN
ncbi:hypothetical protein SAMN04487936_10460 [Halobacillus dabanensis]|uniref:Uncharacterized protein n=1 Tax=Halobacillus dabanensis TaxID=240302 RepID=A0A1I3U1A2_HALDA|nr:hypothetical protein SAMN04487936_10460 [Halobacillus dabanensis]